MDIIIKELIFAIVVIILAGYFFKDLIIVLFKSRKGEAVIVSEGKDGKYYGNCPACGKKNEYTMDKENTIVMNCVYCGEKVTHVKELKQ